MSATIAKTLLQQVLTLAGGMSFASNGMQQSLLKEDDPRVLAELARVVAAKRKDLDDAGCQCRLGAHGQSTVSRWCQMQLHGSGLICRTCLVIWTETNLLVPWSFGLIGSAYTNLVVALGGQRKSCVPAV